uniref:Uncharacterized protein n=1 Tax=Aegilops tauschii subsp. strangulata TaxID=200361 RepID=A0A453ICU0_AEGTS
SPNSPSPPSRQRQPAAPPTPGSQPPTGHAAKRTPRPAPLATPVLPPAPRRATSRHATPPLAPAMPPPSLLLFHCRAPLPHRPLRMSSPSPSRVVCSASTAEGYISAAPILLPDGPWKQVISSTIWLCSAWDSSWGPCPLNLLALLWCRCR